jgi:hypothetical protein
LFCFVNFSFVVPIEALKFEVEFFLRGVECDTQFAKKRGWSLFFLSFFLLFRVVRFWGLEFWEENLRKTVEFMLVVYAGDGSTGM